MDLEKMWDIDHKSQLGDDVTQEEKEYFNKYYEELLENLKDDYEHFKYHSRKFKL